MATAAQRAKRSRRLWRVLGGLVARLPVQRVFLGTQARMYFRVPVTKEAAPAVLQAAARSASRSVGAVACWTTLAW